jgi:hypothetical protein
VFAIFDVKNESMVMLINGDNNQKSSIAYSWKDAKKYSQPAPTSTTGGVSTVETASPSPNAKPMTFTSLGSKTILGYAVEGYRGENEDGSMDVWVSKDPKLAYGRIMGASASMKQMRGMGTGANYPAGMTLEVSTVDKKSGDKSLMTAKSIDTHANVRVSMSEYPRIGAEAKK